MPDDGRCFPLRLSRFSTHHSQGLSMHLSGKSAMVFGGSSGLGAACVRELLAAGAQVAIADLRAPNIAQENENRCLFYQADVTKTEDLVLAFDQIHERFKSLHIVVQCAG